MRLREETGDTDDTPERTSMLEILQAEGLL